MDCFVLVEIVWFRIPHARPSSLEYTIDEHVACLKILAYPPVQLCFKPKPYTYPWKWHHSVMLHYSALRKSSKAFLYALVGRARGLPRISREFSLNFSRIRREFLACLEILNAEILAGFLCLLEGAAKWRGPLSANVKAVLLWWCRQTLSWGLVILSTNNLIMIGDCMEYFSEGIISIFISFSFWHTLFTVALSI